MNPYCIILWLVAIACGCIAGGYSALENKRKSIIYGSLGVAMWFAATALHIYLL